MITKSLNENYWIVVYLDVGSYRLYAGKYNDWTGSKVVLEGMLTQEQLTPPHPLPDEVWQRIYGEELDDK